MRKVFLVLFLLAAVSLAYETSNQEDDHQFLSDDEDMTISDSDFEGDEELEAISLKGKSLKWLAKKVLDGKAPFGFTLKKLAQLLSGAQKNDAGFTSHASLNLSPRVRDEDGDSEEDEFYYLGDPLPKSYDFYKKHKECKIHVGDQGLCGSCTAWATKSALEDALCLKDVGKKAQLSAQNLFACGTQPTHKERNCNSGAPLSTMLNLVSCKGIVKESCQPYDLAHSYWEKPKCHKRCMDYGVFFDTVKSAPGWRTPRILWKKVEDIVRTDTHRARVKAALLNYGPVVFSADVDLKLVRLLLEDGDDYVWTPMDKLFSTGSHAMKIIGYNDETSEPYWLVQNSWGSSFGDNGFFKISQQAKIYSTAVFTSEGKSCGSS